MSPSRNRSLYTGVSERARGWKSRRSERAPERHATANPKVQRWDGSARSSSSWDNLRKDPELWHRDGDCYVHLYGQGQSQRGPAFRLPLASLLEANCYPLVNQFMSHEIVEKVALPIADQDSPEVVDSSKHSRIELYIPAPPGSDKQQAFQYHLATRNFFAFVLRKSVVGEHLGTALITLLQSMKEFRTGDVDNLSDLIDYMDEEGYLDLKNWPTHALAILRFAEEFQLRELYTDAFAHCCGLYDRLFNSPEYQCLTSVTRRLMRRARVEMDSRLEKTCSMLRTFLQDELSESYLGLNTGARSHLERFRTLLHGFYAAKFGYYPPQSIDPKSNIFDIEVFRTMKADFEALYHYLVDESFDQFRTNSPHAQGGICALQSVQSFDTRHRFRTLKHPMPLLPEVPQQQYSKRMSWLNRPAKVGIGQRPELHVALLKATNQDRIELLDNNLVRAYRRFEEDSVYNPLKADKQENITYGDARKTRWILIYTIYQTLLQVTEPPNEVTDVEGVPYNLCISTKDLPPWKDERKTSSLVSKKTEQASRRTSVSSGAWSGYKELRTPWVDEDSQIKPDIDYLALSQRDMETPAGLSQSARLKIPSRGSSLSSTITRNATLRRSMRFFSRQPPEQALDSSPHRSDQHHEIVVLGYGNETSSVESAEGNAESQVDQALLQIMEGPPTSRSPSVTSTSSKYSTSSGSVEGTLSIGDSSVTDSVGDGPVTPLDDPSKWSWETRQIKLPIRDGAQNVRPEGSLNRSRSFCITPKASFLQLLPEEEEAEEESLPHGINPRRSRSAFQEAMQPAPLQIRKVSLMKAFVGDDEDDDDAVLRMPIAHRSHNVWADIKALMEVQASTLARDEDVKPDWDSYNDLGGLAEPKDIPRKRSSLVFG